ncbi:MAG: tRNA lysidine(34) synthetase TilS [Gammaproteobacteria bacterium]|nr:tRNA lysidine(34) synthetase TilS [Gammaproteobacteria bacterium]
MLLSTQWLKRELFEGLKLSSAPRFYVALSGGVDSVVLLHLLVKLQEEHTFDLTALHVNHNLFHESDRWESHCRSMCESLGVAYKSVSLTLDSSSELAARSARYDWFAQHVKLGDVLLTAHHKQDRAETFLFNLMRGAGSTGLSSLRPKRRFKSSWLARPFLQATKEDIEEYAKAHSLSWIDDPSNQDQSYSRNAIRHSIIPEIQKHRADAVHNIARAAANLEEENGLLREIAISDLVDIREQPIHPIDGSHALCTDDMSHLSRARKSNLIRFWLGVLQLHTPSRRLMAGLLNAAENPPNSTAVLQEGGMQFRFYRGFMYVMPAKMNAIQFSTIDWNNVTQPIDIFESRWRLDATEKLLDLVNKRRGAQIRLVERASLHNPKALHGHSLNMKKWMQEMAIPPWRRASLPLLTLNSKKDDILLGVVDQQYHNDWVSLEIAS